MVPLFPAEMPADLLRPGSITFTDSTWVVRGITMTGATTEVRWTLIVGHTEPEPYTRSFSRGLAELDRRLRRLRLDMQRDAARWDKIAKIYASRALVLEDEHVEHRRGCRRARPALPAPPPPRPRGRACSGSSRHMTRVA